MGWSWWALGKASQGARHHSWEGGNPDAVCGLSDALGVSRLLLCRGWLGRARLSAALPVSGALLCWV